MQTRPGIRIHDSYGPYLSEVPTGSRRLESPSAGTPCFSHARGAMRIVWHVGILVLTTLLFERQRQCADDTDLGRTEDGRQQDIAVHRSQKAKALGVLRPGSDVWRWAL